MSSFDYGKVKDPEYFQENRVEAHSDHKYYTSMEAMLQKEENNKYDLNGLWKFHYAKNYESSIKGFEKTEYNCKNWMISVYRRIFKWRDMESLSMQMYSTLGKAGKKSN